MGCKTSKAVASTEGPVKKGSLDEKEEQNAPANGKQQSRKFLDQFGKPTISNARIKRNDRLVDNYTMDNSKVLGTGISGAVREGVHKTTGQKYAIKTLSTKNISPKKAAMLHTELSIYLSLDHPNIAKLAEVYEDEEAVHLVMELCSGRELYDRLASKKKYGERDAATVARQMLSAINYCHRHKICHRDLKLENWVYADPSEDAPLKLIDFGFSRIFNPGVPMTAMHGTVYYVSPEVLEGCYSQMCDIWSIGVIVYMLLSGSPPFNGSHDHEILAKIKKAKFGFEGPRWNGISEDAKDFITHLLVPNPDQRPTADVALKHKWLQQAADAAGAAGEVQIDVNILQNMKKFAQANHVKRAALGLIALTMNTGEMQELEREFRKLDKKNNGTIQLEDLAEVLTKQLNLPLEEAKKVFKALDNTGDHEIHYSEFLAATLNAKLVLNEAMIREAFQKFDVEHTGRISVENLRSVLGDEFGGAKMEDIIKACDYKGQGVIDYDEFLQALTSDEASTAMGLSTEEVSLNDKGQKEDAIAIAKKVSSSLLMLAEATRKAHPGQTQTQMQQEGRNVKLPNMDDD